MSMRKVTTVNLNGNAYQLEEAAYEKLREYLDRAGVVLRANPDRAEILEAHADAVARAHAVLDSVDEAALLETWTLLREGLVVASMTRAEAVSRYVVRHLVHHRGQLTVYLRLCGIDVPAIYGDSADRRLLPPDLVS